FVQGVHRGSRRAHHVFPPRRVTAGGPAGARSSPRDAGRRPRRTEPRGPHRTRQYLRNGPGRAFGSRPWSKTARRATAQDSTEGRPFGPALASLLAGARKRLLLDAPVGGASCHTSPARSASPTGR